MRAETEFVREREPGVILFGLFRAPSKSPLIAIGSGSLMGGFVRIKFYAILCVKFFALCLKFRLASDRHTISNAQIKGLKFQTRK